MKDLRDLKDLTIHDIQSISDGCGGLWFQVQGLRCRVKGEGCRGKDLMVRI